MWQLEKQQQQYQQRSCGEFHECHEHVIGWNSDAGHFGDIVHQRFLGNECVEAADRAGQG